MNTDLPAEADDLAAPGPALPETTAPLADLVSAQIASDAGAAYAGADAGAAADATDAQADADADSNVTTDVAADAEVDSSGEPDAATSAGNMVGPHFTDAAAPTEGDTVAAPGDTPAAAPDGSAAPIPALSPAACAARMAELFPAVFTPGAAKPLKLRIQLDIQQRSPGTFTRKVLSLFLQRHTTSTAYLRALSKQPQRVDLDGQPAGEVSDEHRDAAAAEVNRRHAMHEERRAAQRQAQRKEHEDRRAAERLAQRKAYEEQRAAQRPAQPEAPRAPKAHAEHRPTERPIEHKTPAESPRQSTVQDEERRNRAGLLRAFETTTLTRSNFCVLKRLPEAELDALLAQARQERTESPPAAAPPERGLARPGDRDRRPTAPQHRPNHPRGTPRQSPTRPKPGV